MSRRNAANVPETASFGWKQQSVLTGAIQGTRAVSFGSTGKLLGSPWSLQTIAALPGKAPSITKPALASKGWKWWKKKTIRNTSAFSLPHSVHEIGCLVCLLIYFVRKCIVRRCGLKHVLKYTGLAKPSRNCRNWNKLHYDMTPINIENNI